MDYAERTSPEEYSWTDLKVIADDFAPALMQHLREEIGTLLDLNDYDSVELKKVWLETENVAKGAAKPPGLFVCLPSLPGR